MRAVVAPPTVFGTMTGGQDDGWANQRPAAAPDELAVAAVEGDQANDYDPATQHDPVTGYPDDCAAGTLGVLCAEVSAGNYNFGFTGELTVPNTHDVGILILDQTPSAVTEYGR